MRLWLGSLISLLAVFISGLNCRQATPEPDTAEAFVLEYLEEHPELLLDHPHILERVRAAAANLEEQQRAQDRARVLSTRVAATLKNELTPTSGPSDGSITIYEFSDYQCAPCKATFPELETVKSTNSDLRILYQPLPVYGVYSILAARAALAATKQGRFEAVHKALMTNHVQLDPELLYEIVSDAGVDMDRLKRDMNDPAVAEYLDSVHQLAEQLDITSTPTFIIGERLMRGATTAELLEKALAAARSGQPTTEQSEVDYQ